MRALITGIRGFAGRHLAKLLQDEGLEVWGVSRETGTEQEERIFEADLLDRDAVRTALDKTAPDLIFHLAAQASVGVSWKDPEATIRNNVFAQLNLLEAIRELGMRPRVLVVSSNEVYGAPAGPDELPFRETSALRPNNPYALSKVAQDLMGYQYHVTYGMPIVRVRPFNHLGPGQSDDFVAPSFARQVAEIEAGLREPVIRVGNLEAERDFSDVRDVVRAYYLVTTKGQAGEVYNVGSGQAISIQTVLDFFVRECRVPIKVEVDPVRYRPVDVPRSWTDTTKLRQATGWRPSIPFERTLSDVLESWRAWVRHASPLRDSSLRSE